jgi:elongation factor G
MSRPHVAYREAIRAKVQEVCKYVKQSGGRGQYGHVEIIIEPSDKYEFVDKIKSGAIPKEYIAPTERGVREAMDSGPIAGYPVVNVKVTLVDGSYHDVDSNEMAFKIAGSMAMKSAMKKAKPYVLEPIMKAEIVTPEEYMGDVMADFSSRRGRINHNEPKDGLYFINGLVPLSEMFGYATTLRSLSKGRASYVMEVSSYEEAPKSVVDSLVTQTI